MDLTGTVVFFDIGDTLASVAVAAGGDRIDRLSVYPYVPGVLGRLRDGGARWGILLKTIDPEIQGKSGQSAVLSRQYYEVQLSKL